MIHQNVRPRWQFDLVQVQFYDILAYLLSFRMLGYRRNLVFGGQVIETVGSNAQT